ncbi:DUF1134 domain-containing protein [Novosphingobium pituita]
MMKSSIHRRLAVIGAMAGLSLALAPVARAQVQTIDPNSAIDGDLAAQPGTTPAAPAPVSPAPPASAPVEQAPYQAPAPAGSAGTTPYVAPSVSGQATPGNGQSWHEDDLIGAAEGVFGKGASGLAMMIRDILKKQGEPIGYITGREAGGAFVVGLRYGSGTLHHKIEGTMPVYWTGPSIGFDAGANAGSTFVLVYNLYDTADMYHRFGAGEGQAYLVGGFNVSYLRRGNIVLIPVRMGVGLRLGVNAGYMKFTPKQSWMPF